MHGKVSTVSLFLPVASSVGVSFFFCFYKLWGTNSEDIDDLYFLTEFCWARLEKFGWRL